MKSSHQSSVRKPSPLYVLLLLGLLWLVPWAVAVQYQAALPGYRFSFPRDHASHPQYKTEWWYYTGHLNTAEGKRYGYELTFFRVGLPEDDQARPKENAPASPWDADNLYAAHFALSDETNRRFEYSEKLNRPGVDVAGARDDVYYVWNELWLAELLGDRMVLRANSADGKREIHLLLSSEKPPVVHGQNGVSQKASCMGCASHYYSLTRLKTEGLLLLDGKASPVQGLSWMDHEFGSNQLGPNQVGWDWFSIQLSDGSDLMLYLLRQRDGGLDPNSSGTMVFPDGRSRHLTLKEFSVQNSGRTWTSPKTRGVYPMGWTIVVPSEDIQLTVTPVFENQELSTGASTQVSYWEGSSAVFGLRRGKPVQGQAYVEMTGYAQAFKARI
jgi:predicted secreted hydrolase